MEAGSFVRHSSRAEWGVGVVFSITVASVEVGFEGRGLVRLARQIAEEKLELLDADALPEESPLRDPAAREALRLAPDERPLGEAADLAREMMRDVYWAFGSRPYETLALFDEALREYQAAISGDTPEQRRDLSQIAVPRPRVTVLYRDARWQTESLALVANDGKGFSEVELLWKVHSALLDFFSGRDHHFFEGFELEDAGTIASGPRYHLLIGSLEIGPPRRRGAHCRGGLAEGAVALDSVALEHPAR